MEEAKKKKRLHIFQQREKTAFKVMPNLLKHKDFLAQFAAKYRFFFAPHSSATAKKQKSFQWELTTRTKTEISALFAAKGKNAFKIMPVTKVEKQVQKAIGLAVCQPKTLILPTFLADWQILKRGRELDDV